MPDLPHTTTPDLTRDARDVEGLLSGWFPPRAFVKAAPIGDYPILAEETALMANAIAHRHQEFATGRWLAREGLRSFGLPDAPIPMQRLRNPLWPPSILGAISHDNALCAVALVHNDPPAMRGIGLDLISLSQRAGRVEELAPMFVADPAELTCVARLNPAADPYMLLFGLKECVIKAMTYRLDHFTDFRDIEIRYTNGFDIHLEGSVTRAELFTGSTGGNLVAAAIVR